MQATPSRDIDALIDEVLRTEPMRPVPAGFHARMVRSLRVATVVEQERREFRQRVLMRAALLVLAAPGLVAIAAGLGLREWVATVPGGLGYCDYAWTSTAWASSAMLGSGPLLLLVAGASWPCRLFFPSSKPGSGFRVSGFACQTKPDLAVAAPEAAPGFLW